MRTKLLCGVETGDLRKIGESVEKHPDRREIVRLMQLRRDVVRTKKHWASKAKVTAAVTVRGVETLMTTTRMNAKDTGESPPLEFRVLDLKPCSRPATHIPRANALRDDCFEVHPARMTKRPPSPVIRSASDSSRPLNASCAVPEAQGARPACPPPPPKNPLNADSGFGNGARLAGASAMADGAGCVSATRSVRVSRVWLYALPLWNV